MKILATTQGPALRLMLKISAALQKKQEHHLSLIVTGCSEYKAALTEADLAAVLYKSTILREWELFEKSKIHNCSIKETDFWEKEIGEPLAWTANADRKLTFGKYNRHIQDYKPELSYERVNQIISYAYKAIDQFFYEEKPDVVFGFEVASYCDYIVAKIAAKHSVPYFSLSSLEDGFCTNLYDQPFEWSQSVWEKFGKTSHLLEAGSIKMESIERATEYVEKARDNAIADPEKIQKYPAVERVQFLKALKSLVNGAVRELKFLKDKDFRSDFYFDGYLMPAILKDVIRPWRSQRLHSFMKDRYVDVENLAGGHRRIYFPLHFEPDISALICGRPYQNQIEVIRQLALASPADCEILVQEHAGSLGRRPLSFYKKISEIPKVCLVSPDINSSRIITLCNAVAIVSGRVGLQAAILGKPVLVLGLPAYRHVGEPHFFLNNDPWQLHETVLKVLSEDTSSAIRREGEEKFVRLISIIQEEGCSVDLGSLLLGKKGDLYDNMFGAQMSRREQFEILVGYFSELLSQLENNKIEERVA